MFDLNTVMNIYVLIAIVALFMGIPSADAALELSKESFVKQYLPSYISFSGESNSVGTTNAQLRFPDGRVIVSEIPTTEDGFSSGFYLHKDYPVGEYTITTGGGSATFVISFYQSSADIIQEQCPGCEVGKVTRFIAADSLYVDDVKIRLALVDSPEKGEENYGESLKFAAQMCPIKSQVWYNVDDGLEDQSFGIIAEVFCDGKSLNGDLLRNGHADLLTGFCDFSEFSTRSWAEQGCSNQIDRYAAQGAVNVSIKGDDQTNINDTNNKDSLNQSLNENETEIPDEETELKINVESDIDEKIDEVVEKIPNVPEKITIGGATIEPEKIVDNALDEVTGLLPTVTVDGMSTEDLLILIVIAAIIIIIPIIIIIIIKRRGNDYAQGSFD